MLNLIEPAAISAARASGIPGSEGGVKETAPDPALPLQGKLRLFAPALFGYRPSGLLGAIANSPGLGDLIDWSLVSSSPAYQALRNRKTGQRSKFLSDDMQRRTEDLAARHPILRARVLWGSEEHVLDRGPGRYTTDVSRDQAEGKTHTSVCKPTPEYLHPLEFCEL